MRFYLDENLSDEIAGEARGNRGAGLTNASRR
jgi:hypothetical protein